MNWLKGLIWLLYLTFLCYLLGSSISDEKKSCPYRFITGYLIYSFGVAFFGIIIQLLNCSWAFFFWFMVTWNIFLIIFTLWLLRNRKINPFPMGWKNFFSFYGIALLTVFVVSLFSMSRFPALWLGNHADDGYYLTKMASVPYLEHPFRDNAASGLTRSVIDSYTFNTHEIEAAFYIQLTGITAPLFARAFLSMFNYLIAASCTVLVAETIFGFLKLQKYKKYCQYAALLILVFSADAVSSINTGFLNVMDGWQYSSAMYYGSSIVRSSGIILLCYPFLSRFRISWKTILEVGCIALVLISKSTVALPLILITILAYVTVTLISEGKISLGILFILGSSSLGFLFEYLVTVLGITGDSTTAISQSASAYFEQNLLSVMMLISYLGLIISFTFRKRMIYSLNLMSILLFIYSSFGLCNGLAVSVSQYSFVLVRCVTSASYTFIIITWGYLLAAAVLFLNKQRTVRIAFNGLFCFLLLVNIQFSRMSGGNPQAITDHNVKPLGFSQSLSSLFRNPELFPAIDIRIGNELNRLDSEREEVTLLTPLFMNSDGVSDSFPLMVRAVSPTVIVPGVCYRYDSPDDPEFGTFDLDQFLIFQQFLDDPSKTNLMNLEIMLSKYPINTLLVPNPDIYRDDLTLIGFDVYGDYISDDTGPDYAIFTKSETTVS